MNLRRNKKLLAVIAILLSALTSKAQQSQPSAGLEDPAWLKEFVHKRIVYAVPGMERVKVRKDLTYKRVNNTELKADVYSPMESPQRGARRPAIIFIHGGRVPPNLLTTPKDWGPYKSFGQLVAASDLVGVTFNHRFYAWDSLRDSQDDVMDLIAYLRGNADSLGVDPDRLTLWAFSAGGLFLSRPLRAANPHIRCLVSYYGMLDLQNMRQEVPASVTDEILREYSPLSHLGKNAKQSPPIFIARAGLDDPNLNGGTDRFLQKALVHNINIDLINHATGHHGFDIQDDDARSREIIKRTLEFIKTHN